MKTKTHQKSCCSFIILFLLTTNLYSSEWISKTDSIPLTLTMCANTVICENDTVQIYGIASGGTGSYDYSWSPTTGLSNPNISDPLAFPDSTGYYTLTVNDGISTVSDSVLIAVFYCPIVEITAFPNDTVGLYDTIILSAGSGWLAYLWNNGSSDSTLIVTNTSGPTGGEQIYWATIFGPSGCPATDTISVWFLPISYVCETKPELLFEVYPNPAKDNITISDINHTGDCELQILSMNGLIVYERKLQSEKEQLNTIDVSFLPAGLYLIEVQSIDGKFRETKKFAK